MRSKGKKQKLARRKTKLGLPHLDHAKAAVLASWRSPESQRSYCSRSPHLGSKFPIDP
jgi:hypothetical protein